MNPKEQNPMGLRRVLHTWWPLAASWLLMGVELPTLSAVVARLPDPKIHLAAYGGVVFALSLIIEAPIIMLLAASTALSKDMASYRRVRQFTWIAGATLTALHILIAFTPLYYWVVRDLLGAPPEIIEPARLGLRIMTPWTWAIAYRRFNQGVLIRFGHSEAVGVGTAVRLLADATVLVAGYLLGGRVPGIVVATSAVIAGVLTEAAFVGWRVRPVLREELGVSPPVEPPLTWLAFFRFYIPLALTSLLFLVAQPLGSGAMGRLPQALNSLAVWPVVNGLVFMLRSLGVAYNEVVVALLDEEGSSGPLWRFTLYLGGATVLLLLLIAATPLSQWWFGVVSHLPPELVPLARSALWIALPWPGLSVLQSWYQGAILHSRRTGAITEAILIFLTVGVSTLGVGLLWRGAPGIYIALGAFVIGTTAQTVWLGIRSREIRRAVFCRDRLIVCEGNVG